MIYVNSIANPRRVRAEFEQEFRVVLCGEKKRYFTPGEFDGLTPGMYAHLCRMHMRGESEVYEDSEGPYFMARIFEGWRK